MTYVRMRVSPRLRGPAKPIDLLVDSGSHYCVLPRGFLSELGIEPIRRQRFQLADGRRISRQVGIAYLSFRGRVSATDVIFGGPRDDPLLGVIALEQLGYEVDPVDRRLRRTRFLLMSARAS